MPPFVQTVALTFRYPVYFTRHVFAPENGELRDALTHREPGRRPKVLVAVDAGLARATPALERAIGHYFTHHGAALELVRAPWVLPGGEACKNDPAVPRALLDALHEHGMDRHACVVAVGGGAFLDVVGYAAAITHRGVRLVRVPTTVLAQADSGIGVKNGVNAYGKKNFWGTFTPPHAVLNDSTLLHTLAPRDRIAGMAEAVKVALVRDPAFFAWLEANASQLRDFVPSAVETLVQRSAELHMQHIATAGDPFELGSARPLDFGHWAAHKLESMTDYRLRHGEAVAIGMAVDALYSARIGLCSEACAERTCRLLTGLGFALTDEALREHEGHALRVLGGLEDFREHLGGELTVTLLEDIGRGREVHSIDRAVMTAVIHELTARSTP